MKKLILVMMIFFVLISLSLSMMVANATLLIDSIKGENNVTISFKLQGSITSDEVVNTLKTLVIFSNKEMLINQSDDLLIVKIKDTDNKKFNEVESLFSKTYDQEIQLLEYNIYAPSKEKFKVIRIYSGLLLVLLVSLFSVYKQALKIKAYSKDLKG